MRSRLQRFALLALLALSPLACGGDPPQATATHHATPPAGGDDAGSTPSPTDAPDGSVLGDGSGAFLDTPEVDAYLTAQMQAAHAPGIAVALIKGGHIGWAKGYGLADIDAKRPVTADTCRSTTTSTRVCRSRFAIRASRTRRSRFACSSRTPRASTASSASRT